MKPMIYRTPKEASKMQNNGERIEILYEGDYKEHHFVILSLQTHPTAYVENYRYLDCGELYDKISCHGRLTYDGFAHWNEKDFRSYIGWDYAHGGDAYGVPPLFEDDKQWTTEEIYEEVKNVIEQLIELERGVENGSKKNS